MCSSPCVCYLYQSISAVNILEVFSSMNNVSIFIAVTLLVIIIIVCMYYAVSIALSRSISVFTTILFILCGLGILQSVYAELFSETTDQPDVFKTVAHLDLGGRDDLELVSKDYENDVAYYRYVQPDRDVVVGDTVYLFDGVEATLASVDAVGFTFTCEYVISEGMSGTAILNSSGTQIGCVSRRLDNGSYYAIWN